MFIDKAKVTVVAGDGGNGVVSFRHEIYVDRGGPDGGDGGNGGDVVFHASRNQNTLASFRYNKELKAPDGKAGSKRRKHGKSGADMVIHVPVGTVVREGDVILADLAKDDEQVVIAEGGKGGFGNAHFVSSTRQAPRLAEKGELGQRRELTLELKSIADVGIVGLPNAGKSTLLSRISNARPEIADYPFTTLTPNLGMVDIDGSSSLLFADVPGLIEGASQGKGLGDEFLRHVERTSVLLHLIDAYSDDPVRDYAVIQKELADYQVDLSKRPQLVALTKIEGLSEAEREEKLSALRSALPKKIAVFAMSAASGENVKEVLYELKKMALKERTKKLRKAETDSIPVLQMPKTDEAWHIELVDKTFVVTGRKIEKFAQRTDFSNNAGLQRLRDIMRKMGIMHELERKKIAPGQKIKIGQDSIEY